MGLNSLSVTHPNKATFSLAEDEIHVWASHCDVPSLTLQMLHNFLSEEEKRRVHSYKIKALKHYFIVSHGLLRFILSQYLGMTPKEVTIHYTETGKPFLKENIKNPQALQFNMAHSREKALYALSLEHEVGVDLEYVEESLLKEGLEEYILSPHEQAVLNTMFWPIKVEAFFNAWTRKEAIVKASGEGITSPLRDIEITIDPHDPPKVLGVNGEENLMHDWTLYDLNAFPGYKSALALKGPQKRVIERELTLDILKPLPVKAPGGESTLQMVK